MFTGPARKEAPKPRLMTTEEIESDYDPNESYGYHENKSRIKGGECYTVTIVLSVMLPC